MAVIIFSGMSGTENDVHQHRPTLNTATEMRGRTTEHSFQISLQRRASRRKLKLSRWEDEGANRPKDIHPAVRISPAHEAFPVADLWDC